MVNFERTVESLRCTGFNPMPDTVSIKIPEAKDILWRGLKYFCGEDASWLPEYDRVAEWMTDNRGRGLLCFGNCGRGKTVICGKILPVLINHYCRRIVTLIDAAKLGNELESIRQKHLVCIDDIGVENISVKYGERKIPFAEIVDDAEKSGKLLLITTNLNIDELTAKYGERVVDRLRGITKTVKFEGASMRK